MISSSLTTYFRWPVLIFHRVVHSEMAMPALDTVLRAKLTKFTHYGEVLSTESSCINSRRHSRRIQSPAPAEDVSPFYASYRTVVIERITEAVTHPSMGYAREDMSVIRHHDLKKVTTDQCHKLERRDMNHDI